MMQNNHPKDTEKAAMEAILSTPQGKQLANTLQHLDLASLAKLQQMAKGLDPSLLQNMLKGNNIQQALKSQDLNAKLKELLKG